MIESILSILNWVKDKLPIQDRKERWKNELAKLEIERKELLKGEADAKKVARLEYVDRRIVYYNQLLKNQS